MKKAFVIFATMMLGISAVSLAQDRYVVSASVAFKQNDLDQAKDDIDKAMTSPETMEKPKALWVRVEIYDGIADNPKYKDLNAHYEAFHSLIKLAELKPDYEKQSVDQEILHYVGIYYNIGVKIYNSPDTSAAKYLAAADTMKLVMQLFNVNGGERFKGNSRIDTNKANAYKLLANCTYYGGRYEQAIPMLVEVKNNPITKSPGAYENLVQAYHLTKKSAEEGATIQEGRAAYPNDEHLRNEELAYFVANGKQNELMAKLEESVSKDPNNADMQLSLATAYAQMASPADGKKPANSDEYFAKAEAAYKKAAALKPDDANFNYQVGGFYYNSAIEVNDQINAITGSSDADMKRYDALKAKRDGLFDKAAPYLDKSFNILSPKASAGTLTPDESRIWSPVKKALYNLYVAENKMDKAAEVKKKIEGK